MVIVPGLLRYNALCWIAFLFVGLMPVFMWAEGLVPTWVLAVPLVLALELCSCVLVWVSGDTVHAIKLPLPFLTLKKSVNVTAIKHVETGYWFVGKRDATVTDTPAKFRFIVITHGLVDKLAVMRVGWMAWFVRRTGDKLARMLGVEHIERTVER